MAACLLAYALQGTLPHAQRILLIQCLPNLLALVAIYVLIFHSVT
jgi:uncharacterized membrane protein